MNIRRSGVLSVAVLAWASITPVMTWGQNVYGKIAGTVADSSGASIGEANVTLTNLDTDAKVQIKTDSSGNYSFVDILPGRYKIQVEKSGFKNFVREPIIVEIESGLKIDIVLPVGAASETVEVTGQAPLLQPETNSLGQVIETTDRHGSASQRPQPDCSHGTCAGCYSAGPAFGRELIDRQSSRGQSFCTWRFSDWRRHGRTEPDSD